MDPGLAGSLQRLQAELQRLDDLCAAASPGAAPQLAHARDQLAAAIAALRAVPAEAPRLVDRLVTIALPPAPETFRTKVKVKPAEVPMPSPPTAPPPAAPLDDDLTRIRGIDRELAARLAKAGVTSFAAIAGWAQTDVRRIADDLGLGRQISRQNWIEQAALLRSRLEPKPPAAIIQAAAPDPAPSPAVAVAVVVAAPPPAPDPLDLIAGIDAETMRRLGEAGITRFAEIADWRRADITQVSRAIGRPVDISRLGWIEQAAMLATGRPTHHAARRRAGDFAALVPPPPPEALPEPRFATWQPPPVEVVAPLLVAAPASEIVTELPPPSIAVSDLPPLQPAASPPAAVAIAAPEPPPAPAPPRLAPLAPAATLHIEDEEFAELHVAEADVMIVPARPKPAATKPAPAATARSLISRLKRATPLEDIDQASYAAYRDRVEEASVEIVKPSAPRPRRD